MPKIQRSSDVIEIHSEGAFIYGIGGAVAIAAGGLLMRYRGAGALVGLSTILIGGGILGLGWAIYLISRARKVVAFNVVCPYCEVTNALTATPVEDFSCVSCIRMIPIIDGKIVPVHQVRCGFCNTLNYYSDKTEVLLCENCNHEVPIAQADENRPQRHSIFAVVDDESQYELLLTGFSPHKVEQLTDALQHMLALNRNQVKQLLDELPVTLLTGINRRKAEMLQAQLSIHDGTAEFRVLE